MNIKLIKTTAITLVLISLLSFFSFANDNESEDVSKTTYISSHIENITHGAISTTVTAKVTGTTAVTKVKIKMELQKLSSGTYSTIETWSQTFTARTGSMEESKVTNPFGTYRLKVTFTAYTSSTSETRTAYVYDN